MELAAVQLEFNDDKLREKQIRRDLETQFSELVDGNMRTSFELSFDGHDLYETDGRSMDEVTYNALNDAKKIVRAKPNLRFEVRRRSLEREEFAGMLKMSKGEAPNTMIVLSDFPAELMDAKEDVGGYNVTRKQTMLRVLLRQPDGSIMMHSQSLDGSDRQSLESIYNNFGVKPEPGELLAQRISVDLPQEEQANLVDKLMGIYDRTMTAQYGGEWYAGRKPADYHNTYDFVRKQYDLIETCTQLELDKHLNSKIMYNIAATMQKRFKTEQQGIVSIMPRLPMIDTAVLYREIETAGTQARQTGKSFSACGATLRAEGSDISDNKLEQAGYGNKTDSETKYKFDKKMHCVVCQTKAKEDEPKKMCGPCGICKTCDKKLTSKS